MRWRRCWQRPRAPSSAGQHRIGRPHRRLRATGCDEVRGQRRVSGAISFRCRRAPMSDGAPAPTDQAAVANSSCAACRRRGRRSSTGPGVSQAERHLRGRPAPPDASTEPPKTGSTCCSALDGISTRRRVFGADDGSATPKPVAPGTSWVAAARRRSAAVLQLDCRARPCAAPSPVSMSPPARQPGASVLVPSTMRNSPAQGRAPASSGRPP
jgi:hypothetical protein